MVKKLPSDMYIGCPVQHALQYLGGKWQIGILLLLSKAGSLRFQAIRERLPGLTEKVLSQNLKFFENKGIISRELFESVQLRGEYRLTENGLSLVPIVELITIWGYAHLQEEKATRDMGLTPLSSVAEIALMVDSVAEQSST